MIDQVVPVNIDTHDHVIVLLLLEDRVGLLDIATIDAGNTVLTVHDALSGPRVVYCRVYVMSCQDWYIPVPCPVMRDSDPYRSRFALR